MCSIFGAIGNIDRDIFETIKNNSGDRGRNGYGLKEFQLKNGSVAILGNWRATPTTEKEGTSEQPYDGIVHNGTIANDVELGNTSNDIDSSILPKVIDKTNIDTICQSLKKIVGSYALGIVNDNTVYIARNYKPIYYAKIKDAVYFSSMERHFNGVLDGVKPCMLEPYSVCDLATFETKKMLNINKKALVVASAGLDSTTVAYMLKDQGYDVDLLHFRYGCKAETKEEQCVKKIAEHLNCELHYLDLDFKQYKAKSTLFGDGEISTGIQGAEYAHDWVVARNLLMLANATAFAEANNYGYIAIGNNLEESGAYPDNEEEFTNLLNKAIKLAVADGKSVEIIWPVGNLMKHEIVQEGLRLGVPYDLTWSCYRGGEKHCGQCGPCYMRQTAFQRCGSTDPVME